MQRETVYGLLPGSAEVGHIKGLFEKKKKIELQDDQVREP